MTDEELENLYSTELNKPYAADEYETHKDLRIFKSKLEYIHAENYALLKSVDDWLLFFGGQGHRPGMELPYWLRDGKTSVYPLADALSYIIRFAKPRHHGGVPRLPIIVFASRSAATLIEHLGWLHPTNNLAEMGFESRKFFDLIGYRGAAQMSRKKFGDELACTVKGFLDACQEYAKELDTYLRQNHPCSTGLSRSERFTTALVENAALVVAERVGEVKDEVKKAATTLVAKANKSLAKEDAILSVVSDDSLGSIEKDTNVMRFTRQKMTNEAIAVLKDDPLASIPSLAQKLIQKYSSTPGAYTDLRTFTRALYRVKRSILRQN